MSFNVLVYAGPVIGNDSWLNFSTRNLCKLKLVIILVATLESTVTTNPTPHSSSFPFSPLKISYITCHSQKGYFLNEVSWNMSWQVRVTEIVFYALIKGLARANLLLNLSKFSFCQHQLPATFKSYKVLQKVLQKVKHSKSESDCLILKAILWAWLCYLALPVHLLSQTCKDVIFFPSLK